MPAERRTLDRSSLTLLAGVAALTGAVVLAARVAGRALDDVYITYRYAQNLVGGHGFVFNPGERIFGTTEPGLGLFLAAIHALTRIPIPWLGALVTGVGVVALTGLLAGSSERRLESWVGGALALGSTYLWVCHGTAAGGVLVLLGVAAVLAGDRPVVAGLAAGAAVWWRPDAVVGVVLLVALRWGEDRRVPWRLAGTAASVMALGAGLAWWWFGEMLPHTLAAKQTLAAAWARGRRGSGMGFWSAPWPVLQRHLGVLAGPLVGLGVAGWVPLVLYGGRVGRLLGLYAVSLSVAYPLLEVSFFPWYILPQWLAGYFGVAFLIGSAVRAGRKGGWLRRSGWWVAAGATAGVVLFSLTPPTLHWLRWFDGQPRYDSYRRAAEWISEHSDSDERIAAAEIGYLGFYSRRPVDDLYGLITPRATGYMASRDLVGAFLDHPSDFVLYHSTRRRMRRLVRPAWFQAAYRVVARFPDRQGDGVAVVYRRREGVELPAPEGR